MYVTRVRFQMKRFLAPKSSLQPTGTIDLKTRPFIQSANYCLVKCIGPFSECENAAILNKGRTTKK